MRMKNSDKTLWFLSSWFGSFSVAFSLVIRDHQQLIRASYLLGLYCPFVVPLPHTLVIWSTWKVPGIPEYVPISHPELPFLLCSFPLWKLTALGCHSTISNNLPTPSRLSLPEPQLFSAGTEIFTSAFTNPCSWLKCWIFNLLFPYT